MASPSGWRGRGSLECATSCSQAASSPFTPAPPAPETRQPGRDRANATNGRHEVNRTAVPPPVTMVLDAADAWLPMRMEAVEERLRRLVDGHGDDLAADAGATLAAGGKRLRPMLVLLCGGPGAGEPAVRAAAAIELVHMATLVHDDVLDAAPLRRGLPTVVARAGRATATAVGDRLFSRAVAARLSPRAFVDLAGSEPDDGRRVALPARTSVGLARGELAQRRDAFDI